MRQSRTESLQPNHTPDMSRHAEIRMQQRGIQRADVERAVQYGRRIRARGLTFYVIGRKEVERQAQLGRNISDLTGLQVLVQEDDGVVVTTYRSGDFHSIRATPRGKRRMRIQSQH